METTLHNQERLLVNKFLFDVSKPHDGEIIVFKPPIESSEDFIKRIIGTPGQTITMKNGYVYVNGVLQPESYLTMRDHANFGPYKVPPHDLFVLGDNRAHSLDSRYFGPVPIKNVQGEAFFAYWPLSQFGFLK